MIVAIAAASGSIEGESTAGAFEGEPWLSELDDIDYS